MAPQISKEIQKLTRSIEAHASLEHDLIRYAAPLFAGIRAATFGQQATVLKSYSPTSGLGVV